ncbi:MAG: DUF4199 domain-containing protein [Flavobacteriaceae bacterium]|nr:DUF4199 domain-containing protein [Flavobacteriaceae bacterium]MCY4266558.1 DUF4199 domain-containing protein [Flavobacteriaceae bacterium]
MTNFRSLSFRYGVILGGVGVVWALILFIMDMHDSEDWKLQIVTAIISISVIVFGLLEFRKLNGSLSIRQSVKIAIIISLVNFVIYIIYYFILTNYMDPGMVQRQIDKVMNTYIENNPETSDQILKQIRSGQEMGRKPLIFVGAGLLMSVISGLIFGIILGLFLRRKELSPENEDDE